MPKPVTTEAMQAPFNAMVEAAALQTDAEFEAEMDAVSTVYSLRPGAVLTERQYEAIQAFDAAMRRDQERAVDAYHRGYQDGLMHGGGTDVASLSNKVSELRLSLTTERALKKMDQHWIDRLAKLVVRLSDSLTDEGAAWSDDGLRALRADVATSLPRDDLPDWLLPYRATT